MKTSMAYRLYRLYFNSNSDNHQLFGNRVYNPLNVQSEQRKDEISASLLRALLIAAAVGVIAFITFQ